MPSKEGVPVTHCEMVQFGWAYRAWLHAEPPRSTLVHPAGRVETDTICTCDIVAVAIASGRWLLTARPA